MEIITRAEAKQKGLKFYFTGKPCKRGHISESRVSGSDCLMCKVQYRADNKENRDKYISKYRIDNREAINKTRSKYRADNKKVLNKTSAQYRIDNREPLVKYHAKYKRENPIAVFVRGSLNRIH